MNQASSDLHIYDFGEEDEVTDTSHLLSKVSNPNNQIPNNQFSQNGSTGYMKEIYSVEHIRLLAIDDASHGFNGDASCGPLDLLGKDGFERPAGCDAILYRNLQQCEGSINPESSSPGMGRGDSNPLGYPPVNGHGMGDDSPFRSSPVNGHTSSGGPESPSNDGSVDAGTPDGNDGIQVRCPHDLSSPVEENSIPRDAQDQEHSFSGLEMEESDTVALHTDYTMYGTKYFPASEILISKDNIRLETSTLEEEGEPHQLEWEVDDILRIESQWSSVAYTAKVKFHLLNKGAMLGEKAHDASGVEVLEFVVYDPDWSRKQEWIRSLDVRLNALWSAGMNTKSCDGDAFRVENRECPSDPYIPSFKEPFEEVVYPEGDADAVSISKRDVDLLEPEIFVNDTIIDFYMKYVRYVKNEIPPQERDRFHFFNSFFFRKLADLDKNPSSAFDGKAAFQRVRKWTRKVNIFEKDFIFIPVNYNLHWSLLVICHPGEVSNFNDENAENSLKVPCILHMDSIRGSHMGLKDLIQSYLLEEWKEKKKDNSDDISSKFLNLRFLSLELPQQENLSDCGLFLLHYAELFITETPANFSPFRINKYDSFLKPDWFVPAEASLKRVHIQRLIYELLESRSQRNALPSSYGEAVPSAVHESSVRDNRVEIHSEKKSTETYWDRGVTYSQSIQGMEMGLLDASLYRTSQCISDPGIGMTELLQQCQQFGQSASLVRLGCSMSPIREEMEDDENPGCSTLGQPGVDFDGGFTWNPELSDHGEPEEDSLPGSNCPSDDDSDEITIIEFNPEKQGAGTDANENQNFEASKENMHSFTENYASASGDMMETPPEDCQELDKIYGYQEDPQPSDPEELLQASSQELSNDSENEDVNCPDQKLIHSSPQELSKDDENEDAAHLDEKLIHSSPLELGKNNENEDAAYLDEKLIHSSPQELGKNEANEDSAYLDEKLIPSSPQDLSKNDASEDAAYLDEKLIHSSPQELCKNDPNRDAAYLDEKFIHSSPQDLSKNDVSEDASYLDEKLIHSSPQELSKNDANQDATYLDEKLIQSSPPELSKNDANQDAAYPDENLIHSPPQELSKNDENGDVDEEVIHPSSQELGKDDEIAGNADCPPNNSVVEGPSSDSDVDRASKRMRLTPSLEIETGLPTNLPNGTLSVQADDACA